MIKLFLPKFWYQRNIISYLLLPFSFIYRLLISLYRFYYVTMFPAGFSVPIIIVGNITVGGTGKTPMVIYLVELLKQQGYKPGVIARGYGRKKCTDSIVVSPNSKVEEVGDEALLIAHRVTSPVIVDNNRTAAAKKLLNDYNCNVIISDDGLQHYRLPRYIEISLVDEQFRFGNTFCLPAGPLREPISRLKGADFVVTNFNSVVLKQNNKPVAEIISEKSTPKGEYGYSMILEPTIFRNVRNPEIIKRAHDFKEQTIYAVAGIGMPDKFFRTLERLGLNIIPHPFHDHHIYCGDDFSFANKTVIMTEKDAVKCRSLANEDFWYLEVKAKPDERFIYQLLNKLKKYPGL